MIPGNPPAPEAGSSPRKPGSLLLLCHSQYPAVSQAKAVLSFYFVASLQTALQQRFQVILLRLKQAARHASRARC